MMNRPSPTLTTIPLHPRVRRAAWGKAVLLLVCTGVLLLTPLTGLLELTNIVILFGLCLIPASLAIVQLMTAYRVRLELHPDSVALRGLGFRLVTTRMNIDRIGPSPWNNRHLALMLRNPAQRVDGLLATAMW